ncbi:MAG TPA: NADH-quinone oxidoreductase subunit I [Bacteroidota bacterium]|nr:NADH-quinone oxidoreductase subunit I [Bacteroidota bacterium]
MKEYFGNIFRSVWTVLIGMKVTASHLFTPAVTIQYPDVRLKLPERARNRLYVNMDDCIGCFQCDMACPVDCISIETVKSLPTDDLGTTSTGQKKKLWVTKFDIDIAKCCYCGLCVYPCPTECIKMTDVYEFSEYDRKNLIYNYATLTPAEVADVKAKAAEMEKEAAAKKAAAAAAAAQAKAAAPAPPAAPKDQPPASPPAQPHP